MVNLRSEKMLVVLILGVFLYSGCGDKGEKPVVVDLSKVGASSDGGTNGNGENTVCTPGTGQLCVGAAKRDVTPYNFELAKLEYLELSGDECEHLVKNGADPTDLVHTRCGYLYDMALYDCGTDMLCPGDEGYTGKDADGTQNDDIFDFFYDCGLDRLCPGDEGYTGPDADGTEGNGKYDTIPIAGNASNRVPMDVHDPVWARAAVISDGKTTIAIAALDFIGVFNDDIVDIEKKVEDKLGEGAIDKVIVSATHNHNGPDTMGQWGLTNPDSGIPFKTGINYDYQESFKEATAEAIKEAYENMRVAKIKVATTYTNKDDEWGLDKDSRDPGVLDDTAAIIYAEDAEKGDGIATLVSWAAHPETLSDHGNSYTSDFPNYFREAIENGMSAAGKYPERKGLGGIAIYIQSDLGGQVGVADKVYGRDSVLNEGRTWQKMQAVGERLAEYVYTALEDAPYYDKSLDISLHTLPVMFNIENVIFRVAFFAHIFPTRTVFDANGDVYDKSKGGFTENPPFIKSELVYLKFGDSLHLMTAPGELHPELLVGGTDLIDDTHGSWSCGKYTKELVEEDKCQRTLVKPNNENPPNFEDAPPPPYIRDWFGDDFLFYIGLGQDELGYFVAPFNYELDSEKPYLEEAPGDHYEETNGLGPSATPHLLESYQTLLCPIKSESNLAIECD